MKLDEYLTNQRLSAQRFAQSLGICGNYMRYIRRGTRYPSEELSEKIEMITGGQVRAEEVRPKGTRARRKNK